MRGLKSRPATVRSRASSYRDIASRTRSVHISVSLGSEGIQVMYATVSPLAVASPNNRVNREERFTAVPSKIARPIFLKSNLAGAR